MELAQQIRDSRAIRASFRRLSPQSPAVFWDFLLRFGRVDPDILALSANTAFADFPRLCRAIAQNNYLPHSFATRGRRLVYTQGIVVLAVLSGILLIIFGGITDRLIPLFAVGAFLAFTLSQAGMVSHWARTGGPGAKRYMLVNGVGAVATGITGFCRAGSEIYGWRLDYCASYPGSVDFDGLRASPLPQCLSGDHGAQRRSN